MTWWTLVAAFVVFLLSTVFTYYDVPFTLTTWVVIFLVVLACGCAAVGASQSKTVGKAGLVRSLLRRLSNAVLANPSPKPILKRLVIALTAAFYLLSVYAAIPAATGRHFAQGYALLTKVRPDVLFLLHMKDESSMLHGEVVEMLVPGQDYIVVRLALSVPHPSIGEGRRPMLDPATQPKDKAAEVVFDEKAMSFSIRAFSPILVSRDSIESMSLMGAPEMLREAFQSIAEEINADIEQLHLEPMPGGGYKVDLSGRIAPTTTSAPFD